MSKRVSWNKEMVIEKIKEYHSQGISLKGGDMNKLDSSLCNASRRYFGNWRGAVIESGIDYDSLLGRNKVVIVGDHKEILVTQKDGTKHIVLVDIDFDETINVFVNGGYPKAIINKKSTYLHCYLYGEVNEGNYVDHHNRNKFDCRMSNLREVTPSQNGQNILAKGYTFHRRDNKWQATIHVNGKTFRLFPYRVRSLYSLPPSKD